MSMQKFYYSFMVGPGNVVLEGRGWKTNCIEFKQKDREEVPVWNPSTETRKSAEKAKDVMLLKDSLGFKKPATRQENLNKIMEEIRWKRLAETLETSTKDNNKYFGKTIVIGMITEVFCK